MLGATYTYFANAGEAADDVSKQLDDLTLGTDKYKQLLNDIAPLQIAFLQNLIDTGTAASEAKSSLKSFFDSIPDNIADPGDLRPAAQSILDSQGGAFTDRSGKTPSERLIQSLIRDRAREDAAIDQYLNRDKPGIIAKAERKPGLEVRDYYIEDQKNIKKVADERERDAKAAATQAEQRKRVVEQAKFEANAAERLAKANEESAEAVKRLTIQLESERRILTASQTLKGAELEALKAEEAQRVKSELAILATTEARKRENEITREAASLQEKYDNAVKKVQDKVVGDIKRDQEAEAKRQADILAQPYKDLAGDVSSIVADGIKQGLEGDLDVKGIADSFGDAMATTISGSIAAALTETLSKAALNFGDYLSAQISQATATQGAGGSPGAAGGGQIGYGGAAVGGAAGGYLVGSLYGQATGKEDTYAATGGSIGGALGATAGFAVGGPVGALIGGALGSIAGSAIGGLFGGEGLGNDRSSQSYRSGRGIVYSDQSFSQGNRNVTSGILGEITALEEAFSDLGGIVGDVKLRVEAGNKSGITVNGKKYATAEDALRASIELLIGGTSGLSATQSTILANSKGGSAAEIGQDLAFGETYDRLIFNGREVDQVLQDLNATFQQAAREAAKLGLDVGALTAAHQREADAVVVEFQARQRGLSISLGANAPGNALNTALQQLELTMQELARQAVELSVPLEQVTAAHQREADALVVQFQAQQRGFYGTLASVRGDDSVGTQLYILETQMQELARQAANLNIPLEAVTQAHQIAAERIIEADREIRRNFEQDVGLLEAGDLANQIAQIGDRFGALIDQAIELGYATDGLTAAQKRAEDQAIDTARQQLAGTDQQLVGANRSAYGAIDQFLDPIKQALGPFGIGQGVFSGAATAQGGIEEFRRQLELAQGGDTGALSSLVGTGQSAIQAARAFGASGSDFQAIFREVNKGLLETQGQLEQRRLDLAQKGVDFQRETIDEILRLRVEAVQELRELREQLRRDLAIAIERRAA